MQHLLTEYATVTDDELISNAKQLQDPWDNSLPLSGLWARQDQLRDFSLGHDDITMETMTRSTFTILENLGVYPETCRDWRLLPRAQQTWATLKRIFKSADEIYRIQVNAGHFANLATRTPTPRGGAQTTLTRPNVYANGLPRGVVVPPDENGRAPRQPDWIPYCFTHGVTWDPTHTSNTCANPCANHVRYATIDNMIGGNNTIRRQSGERAYGPAQPRARQRNGAGRGGGRGPPNPNLGREFVNGAWHNPDDLAEARLNPIPPGGPEGDRE